MPGPTPHYPPEFKREAVQLYHSSEKSIPKVAKDLGIADESLRRWVRQIGSSAALSSHARVSSSSGC